MAEEQAGGTEVYWPEIDGLRCLAICAVVGFHYFPSAVPGGYLGVDLFFVLSGYVITSAMLKSKVDGVRFSLLTFWGRRIRRLLPALMVLFIGFSIAAPWVLYGFELESAITEIGWAVTSTANIYFWRAANNYWGHDAEGMPFLHMWSLSVEEQFYLGYGLLFWSIADPKLRLWGIGCLGLLSFVVAGVASLHAPAAGFYLPFARAWQPLVGCLLPLVCRGDVGGFLKNTNRFFSVASASTGKGVLGGVLPICALAAVVVPMVVKFRDRSVIAFMMSISVCTGTAWILWILRGCSDGRLAVLRNPVLVRIGKYSYSLYLWHWPVVVLCRKCIEGNEFCSIVSLIITLLLAALAFHLVENPVRKFRGGLTFWCLFFEAVVLVGLLSVPNSRTGTTNYRLGKYTATTLTPDERREAWGYSGEFNSGLMLFDASAGAKADILILGDSHAEMWCPVFRRVAIDNGWNLGVHAVAGVPVFVQPNMLVSYGRSDDARVRDHIEDVVTNLLRRHRPKLVVLVARWEFLGRDLAEIDFGVLMDSVVAKVPDGSKILMISQPPRLPFGDGGFGADFGREMVYIEHPPLRRLVEAKDFHGHRVVAGSWLKKVDEKYEAVRFLDVDPVFTSLNGIRFASSSTLLYRDDDHLSEEGAMMCHEVLDDVIHELLGL